MEVYLDNSATTRCYEQVKDIVVQTMMNDYGNPSAMHTKGVTAEQYVRKAAQRIAKVMKVQEKEIYFTSGGTESDNWALIGAAMANQRQGKHIITTSVEHPAVSAPLAYLEEQGFQITRLSVGREGVLSLEELEKALRKDTILVSTMYVNNEIGAVEPVEQVGRLLKEKAPQALYHVDAIQAFGKYRIYPKKMGIDLLAVSGHKIHGPKGIGFLYVNEKCKIRPLILGGGQQKNMRSGTDNVPGIAGIGVAAEEIYRNFEAKIESLYEHKAYFREQLGTMEEVVLHGPKTGEGAPHIVNASFLGIRSEVLLHTLEDRGIYVSAGSACSTHKRAGSPTLTAIGASKAEMESAVRFSFSENTTREELDYCLEALREVVPMLRRYARH